MSALGAKRSTTRDDLFATLKDKGVVQTGKEAEGVDLGTVFQLPVSGKPIQFQATLQINRKRFEKEKEAVGFYITGHPMAAYKAEIEAGGSCYEGRLQELIDQTQGRRHRSFRTGLALRLEHLRLQLACCFRAKPE